MPLSPAAIEDNKPRQEYCPSPIDTATTTVLPPYPYPYSVAAHVGVSWAMVIFTPRFMAKRSSRSHLNSPDQRGSPLEHIGSCQKHPRNPSSQSSVQGLYQPGQAEKGRTRHTSTRIDVQTFNKGRHSFVECAYCSPCYKLHYMIVDIDK